MSINSIERICANPDGGRNRKGAVTTTIARTGARRLQAFADNEAPNGGLETNESALVG